MIIGITGGIASGKSTVINILKEEGAVVIDLDQIGREIMRKGEKGWKMVIKCFSPLLLDEEGYIDRKKLGKIIFRNPQWKNELENITHPLIFQKLEKRKRDIDARTILIEVPLLYETGFDQKVDEVWVVYVDQETQIKRLQNRDKISRKEAREKIATQMPLEMKKEKADLVIDNRKNKIDLENELKELWRRYQ